ELLRVGAPDVQRQQRSDDGKNHEDHEYRDDPINHFLATSVKSGYEGRIFLLLYETPVRSISCAFFSGNPRQSEHAYLYSLPTSTWPEGARPGAPPTLKVCRKFSTSRTLLPRSSRAWGTVCWT